MHESFVSRRRLLQAAGAVVVSFSTPALAKSLATDRVDGFLAIAPDGSVTIYTGKVDLGTGARIAYRQMVAEELFVPIDRIALIEGDTELTPDQGGTGGSTGVAVGGIQLRQAAATARAAMLAGATGLNLPIDRNAKLVSPSAYRIVGKSLPRPDLPAKFTGAFTYVQDFSLPDMLHGRVIRPPSIGATLSSLDESSIAQLPGIVKIVRMNDFLGVVAETEWAAIRAARQLAATWTPAAPMAGSTILFDTVRATPIAHDETLSHVGDAAAAVSVGAQRLMATYQWPPQSHGSIGPSCAVADVRADGATIWTGSQQTHKYAKVFARFLELPPDSVRMIYLNGAGSYGMNGHDDAAADAALMSRAVGRPVRVQWMRADEHGWDPKGPPQLVDLRAALDEAGHISAWETQAWLPLNTPGLPAVPLLAPRAARLDQPEGNSSAQIQGNLDPPYVIANMRAVVHWLTATPLRPSNLRAPGKIGNIFAVESFTDELAAAARTDPIAFRLQMLTAPRGIAVLTRVAASMVWQPRPSPAAIDPAAPILHGRGIAYVHYKHVESFIALGMEVSVDRANGKIRVLRAVCAHDCGLMINPDAVHAQVEGCILQTISRTLFEEVTFDSAGVTSLDWSSYPILTFADVPILDIELINRPEAPPWGAGEAATAPVAAALGNAVFDATGVRLRTVPFTPERVKAALGNAV
jgi:CO/xanthine dehydrogenase Mo-binding subunit